MSKISTGDTVKLISKRTDNTYQVTKLFKNIKGELWAECINIDSEETSDHPVYDLETV